MGRISSGIASLDALIDSYHIGDNVVWEVESGTLYPAFIHKFIARSFRDARKVIYVSFNTSPQALVKRIGPLADQKYFILVDCFTSGKGKNDPTFLHFYEHAPGFTVVRIDDPRDVEGFTKSLNSIEEGIQEGVRYIFDSLTGMQDLWGNEETTYRFFTYMCPRLYDLGTVAYWILEKDAHSPKFKANLRHITQVVFDIYKRRERLFLKALKLEGRQDREAFKPHLYEMREGDVVVTLPRREQTSDIGTRIKEERLRIGMSQKDLADKVNLTASFLSQLENNQISPSLNSFMQICAALGTSPSVILEGKAGQGRPWVMRRQGLRARPARVVEGVAVYRVFSDEQFVAYLAVFPPGARMRAHVSEEPGAGFVYVICGDLTVTVEGGAERLTPGDCLVIREVPPAGWHNEGGDEAEILVVVRLR